ncbi:hypothetical protein EIP86_009552 [Pleurotus ostreatoroseus]|nr:hypothetical protein EIP86_009552 [Pleurotus ostreatoroseus]
MAPPRAPIPARQLEYGAHTLAARSRAHTHPDASPDIPTAVAAALDAFADDPLGAYIADTPDSPGPAAERAAERAELAATYAQLVHRRRAWTVDGVSVVGYTPYRTSERRGVPTLSDAAVRSRRFPGDAKPAAQDPLDALLRRLHPLWFRRVVLSREQKKRLDEIKDRVAQAAAAALGPRLSTTAYIGLVCTARAAQGRGYASALIARVTAQADRERRGTWLVSSNTANEGFYNSVGFVTRGEIVVGEGNKTWGRPPVVMHLVRACFPFFGLVLLSLRLGINPAFR